MTISDGSLIHVEQYDCLCVAESMVALKGAPGQSAGSLVEGRTCKALTNCGNNIFRQQLVLLLLRQLWPPVWGAVLEVQWGFRQVEGSICISSSSSSRWESSFRGVGK